MPQVCWEKIFLHEFFFSLSLGYKNLNEVYFIIFWFFLYSFITEFKWGFEDCNWFYTNNDFNKKWHEILKLPFFF